MSTGPAEHAEGQREQEPAAIYPLLNFNSTSASPTVISMPWGMPLTTTLTPEEQRAEWERERAQAETAGAAEQRLRDDAATGATEDKEFASAEDGKAGEEKEATATAAEAGQSDRTSGAYRLL